MPDTKLAPPAGAASPNGARQIPAPLLHEMESRFGCDFSKVKVHEDQRATMLGAAAYTMGLGSIFFAPGAFQPGTETGQQLIAHELSHVAQQRGVRPPDVAPGLVQVDAPKN